MANNNYRNNSRNNNGEQQQKKRTGAKATADKRNGSPVTTGWNYSKRHGLVTFLCVTTKKSDIHKSKSGKEWINVMVKVRYPMQPEQTTNGLMDKMTGKVIIQSMGIVINPKAKNGGYCGRYGTNN